MKVFRSVDITKGLINAISPSSGTYPEGAAWVSDNSRIDKNGVWNKGPSLGSRIVGVPSTVTHPGTAGLHFASVSILGSHKIVKNIGDTCVVEGPNGYVYFPIDGEAANAWSGTGDETDVGITAPTSYPTIAISATGARQESGIYYYMATIYNPDRDVESLPSYVGEHWVGRIYAYLSGTTNHPDQRIPDVPRLSGITSSGNKIRWYRSKVVKIKKGDTFQTPQANMPTEFYFVGEVDTGSNFDDYAHDSEIATPENLYTGRGSKPVTDPDILAVFDNKMFYFYAGKIRWSSSGRPEEVPQEYSLTVRHDYSVGTWGQTADDTFMQKLKKGTAVTSTVTKKPLLDTGVYAEALIMPPELAGKTVKAAIEYNGKLWVFCETQTGYIVPSASEGYKYVHVSGGIGAVNQWVLAKSPYGLFGADQKGVWVVTESIRRLSDGIIDIGDSDKSTYAYSISNSFGVWVDLLNEYLWCYTGSDSAKVQLAYQADKERFVGPYALSVTGGCTYNLGDVSECYMTSAKTPILSTRSGAQTLKFWMGQSEYVKDNLKIEILYDSIS